jgi:hypothetical protein
MQIDRKEKKLYLVLGKTPADGAGLLGAEVGREILLVLVSLPCGRRGRCGQ